MPEFKIKIFINPDASNLSIDKLENYQRIIFDYFSYKTLPVAATFFKKSGVAIREKIKGDERDLFPWLVSSKKVKVS